MKTRIIVGLSGAICLSFLGGCDMTYTGAHKYSGDASTGSHLSGTDTGLSAAGSSDASITNNAGGSGSYGSH